MLLQPFFDTTHFSGFRAQANMSCGHEYTRWDPYPPSRGDPHPQLTIYKSDALNHKQQCADCVAFSWCTHGHYIAEVWNDSLNKC